MTDTIFEQIDRLNVTYAIAHNLVPRPANVVPIRPALILCWNCGIAYAGSRCHVCKHERK